MKTAALFSSSDITDTQFILIQCRLMSLLTCGHWSILIPDQPGRAECHIVETCLKLKRDIRVVGLNQRSLCGAPGRCYQQLKIPRFWPDREWQRDSHIIQQADMVMCFQRPDVEERVPLLKCPAWMGAIRVIDPSRLTAVDYKTALVSGLGALLVQKLSLAV